MDYSDIIDMPHHVSEKHSQMSMWNRAAQFAPFAALTGYDNVITETAKENEISYNRKESDEDSY
ncbi:MAG: hypothetical protein J6P55_08640 [Bacteroidaceae bacterium]|nr:hypothetical protein [Bacteroidaceae bacterium]MBR1902440.1 hypothetical protein [Bacteroidaceae bacterium]